MCSPKASSAAASDPLFKRKGISDIDLNSEQQDAFATYRKKPTNGVGTVPSKPWAPQNPSSKAWGRADTVEKLGMRNGMTRLSWQASSASPSYPRRPGGRGYIRPQSANVAAGPRLRTGTARVSWGSHKDNGKGVHATGVVASKEGRFDEDEDDESEDTNESDDELLSDGYDSDDVPKSHEERKNDKWFKDFFECLDVLTVEQINEPDREWHCPACKGGPGAIDWYRGLQPLITHAKTKRSKRAKLHRELAELLNEELRRRESSAVQTGEVFGKWKGQESSDKEIVWPPIVVIMNTRYEKDDNDKWIGMGNQELLDYIIAYSPVKARHSYGPHGHRGISVAIFEATAVGYMNAERLSNHLESNSLGRLAWEKNYKYPYYPGGIRQLYGFIAEKQDMEYFNQHSTGKSRLKYEMLSYEEMVVKQMKQMSEDNQQLLWFKNKAAREQKSRKATEEQFSLQAERLWKMAEENRIMKQKTKKHYKPNKEEMDSQENFFKDQIQKLLDARHAQEEQMEKLQQDQREKEANESSLEESLRREEGVKEYQSDLEQLKEDHEEQELDLQRRFHTEKLALERQYNAKLALLVKKHTSSKSNTKNTGTNE